jgi:peptide/nickel transport system ATP-binding protein
MLNDISIRVQNLKGYYRGSFGVIHAVEDVSLVVRRGDILGLAGESGCGKSTLLKLLIGVPEPPLSYEGGEVKLEGYDIWKMDYGTLRKKVLGKCVSYVPQSSCDALNPVLRIRQFIADLLKEQTGHNYSAKEIREMLVSHFASLGLDKRILDLYPHELSGGMKQRSVVAISTYLKPSILLLDEPTSALDVTSQKRLIEMLASLYQEGITKTIVISAHDLAILRQICNRIAIMYAGKIVEVGKMDDVVGDPLHPYTELLINSLMPLERRIKTKKLTALGGRPPDLRVPPQGCRFNPRCPSRMDVCMSKEPSMIEEDERLVACWLHCGGRQES